MAVFKVFSQARVSSSSSRLLDGTDGGIHGVFRTFPRGEKSAEVLRQSSARVPASPSSSELGSHQMAPARESDEIGEDGTGDSLSAAYRGFTAVAAAGGRRGRGLRRGRWCSCAEVRGFSGDGRPCAPQRQVPAVQGSLT